MGEDFWRPEQARSVADVAENKESHNDRGTDTTGNYCLFH